MAVMEVLGALALAGVMGTVGQGARTLVGLKKLNDENALKPPSEVDTFIVSRLVISLFIGFIVGIGAAIALGLKELAAVSLDNLDVLMGIAAAGYAGTDAIEGFVSKLRAPGGEGAVDAGQPPVVSPPQSDVAALDASVTAVSGQVEELRTLVLGPALLASTSLAPGAGDALDQVTAAKVKSCFHPATPLSNIVKHLPDVIKGLRDEGLADVEMLAMALGTIRAETEGFVPISELKSKFNTKNTPFDLYDAGTSKGKTLGNTHPGDGPRYKGRGFVQLTGRDNYTRIGNQLDIDLAGMPELANDSVKAGRILARFLKNKDDDIRAALEKGDLAKARKLVNGGSHGLDRFIDTYDKARATFK